jgi:plasmid rolling circle replication initiator protein Rep
MEIIAKYSALKKRSREMGLFIKDLVQEFPNRQDYRKLEANVLNCASYLVFNNYYTIDEVKLSKAQTCKKHMLCPFCARRRAAKMVEKNIEKFNQVIEENPKLVPAMLTVTVKNGDDLNERYQHIKNSFRLLQERRRNYLKRGRGFNEFCKIEGAVFSYEITHSEDNKWHPHIHAVVLLSEYIDVKKFSDEWHKITGDSYIVDIRKISKKNMSSESSAIADAMCEVFKYALKFSDLTLERQFEAYETLKGQRMLGAFGLLHGVKVPESLLDDLQGLEALPYFEMFYSFKPKKGVYDLARSEHREPKKQSFDNDYEVIPITEYKRSETIF